MIFTFDSIEIKDLYTLKNLIGYYLDIDKVMFVLQKKYEDVCNERDKVSHLAKSLKEQLNKANTAQKEDHEDKVGAINRTDKVREIIEWMK